MYEVKFYAEGEGKVFDPLRSYFMDVFCGGLGSDATIETEIHKTYTIN